jgi:protein-L-isoaspartate O-methyltransferase
MTSTDFYSTNATSISAQYDGLDFKSVHADWLDYIPEEGSVLDIGAGSGRDARHLAQKGLSVTAVEPSNGLREIGIENSKSYNITWLDDSLPELSSVFKLETKYDLILLSAVWMHIPKSNRDRAIRKLSNLLKPNGKIIISLRHGVSPDERVMYDVSSSELATLATEYGLQCKILSDGVNQDTLGRDDVTWETVALTLPDDGSGSFPLLRNIIINDSKSSTYKLGLLRSILRIAEGNVGAVIERTDTHVSLPLGLVAFYWLKIYKILIDTHDIQQVSGQGVGFIKPDGWAQITHLSNNDLFIGAVFTDTKDVLGIDTTLKHIASVIKHMPCKYLTFPGTQNAIFDVNIRRKAKPNSILFDLDYFKSFGELIVPRSLWELFTQYSVWVEPVLLSEWVNQMATYKQNHHRFQKHDLYHALQWIEPKHSTAKVRNKVDELLSTDNVNCCWSGKTLKTKYAIDHAFPFSRWPNNDLWNLLPSKVDVNSKKSDKLPTHSKLSHSKEYITDWWQQAWHLDTQVFFNQANIALPDLNSTDNFEDVFEAMLYQRNRIKALQQLPDWE